MKDVANYMKFYMRSGGCLDFSRDTLDFFPMEDVLFSLAKEHRFFNQIEWSVLQHSIACGIAGDILYGDNALLVKHLYVHDFTEAFLRDVPAVVKCKEYKEIEHEVQTKIFNFINLPHLGVDDHAYLKGIDVHMRLVETFYLYASPECFEAIKAEVGPIEPEVLLACTDAFLKVQTMDMFDENLDISNGVVELFKGVLRKY